MGPRHHARVAVGWSRGVHISGLIRESEPASFTVSDPTLSLRLASVFTPSDQVGASELPFAIIFPY
jgi:hypothetical protein